MKALHHPTKIANKQSYKDRETQHNMTHHDTATMNTSTSSCTSIQQSSTPNCKRRKRVLLGITGSVAAIKGPELALQLSKELDAHVAILLTRGGENFWLKAKDYNPQIWGQYCEFVANVRIGSKNAGDDNSHAVPSLPQDDDPRSIVMYCKLFTSYFIFIFMN